MRRSIPPTRNRNQCRAILHYMISFNLCNFQTITHKCRNKRYCLWVVCAREERESSMFLCSDIHPFNKNNQLIFAIIMLFFLLEIQSLDWGRESIYQALNTILKEDSWSLFASLCCIQYLFIIKPAILKVRMHSFYMLNYII